MNQQMIIRISKKIPSLYYKTKRRSLLGPWRSQNLLDAMKGFFDPNTDPTLPSNISWGPLRRGPYNTWTPDFHLVKGFQLHDGTYVVVPKRVSKGGPLESGGAQGAQETQTTGPSVDTEGLRKEGLANVLSETLMDTTFSGSETLMDAPTLGVSYTVDLDDLFWSPTPGAMAGTSPDNSSSLKTETISDETVYFSGGAALTSIDPYVGVELQIPTVYFSGGSAGLQNTWSAKDGSGDSTAAGGLQEGTGGTNTPELPDEERLFTNRYRWPYGTEEEDEFQEAPHTFPGPRETSEKALQIVWDALGSSGALSRRPELRSEFY
jgi:hypothetical protein